MMKERILNTNLLPDQIAFFYLGQEGYIMKSGDHYLMIDGYLSNAKSYPENPNGRLYPAPIEPEDLDFLDLILVTHDHMDHANPETLNRLAKANTKASFVVPAPFVCNVVEYGVPADRIIPAHDGDVFDFGFVKVRPIPAAHEELRYDENGDVYDMGYVFDMSGIKLYHAGDCCLYDGIQEKIGDVDVTMLPINGRSFYRLRDNIIGNMNFEEAVKLTLDLHAKFFIPMHFDMFPGNSVPASSIPATMQMYAPKMPYKIFLPGERMIYAN